MEITKQNSLIDNETSLYKYDEAYHEKLLKDKPWTKEYVII